ncbi:MAG: DJ-1/PfpI family protein [Clostridia bacterium]|nr:DJ-1/PfpI family protein [Clostridia bacterium]
MEEKKKVAVMFANGFEEIEALTVVDIIRRSNIECDMISIENKEVQGCHGVIVKADKIISDINKNEYTMIVLPGGLPGADNLRDCNELIEWIKVFANNPNKYVAAICAAPQVFAKAGIVKGKKVTSYPSSEFRKILNEAEYIDDVNQKVVADGNIITSRGPATAFPFAYRLVEILGGNAEMLKQGMLWNY